MKTKFTKGPWIKDKRGESLVGSSGKCVTIYNCGLSTGGGKEDEYVANANLIAAAPDMYKALEKTKQGYLNLCELDIIPEGYQKDAYKIIDQIHKLLSKARGEQ